MGSWVWHCDICPLDVNLSRGTALGLSSAFDISIFINLSVLLTEKIYRREEGHFQPVQNTEYRQLYSSHEENWNAITHIKKKVREKSKQRPQCKHFNALWG